MLRVVRCLLWVIFSVLLVLLVPSSAWSDDTASPLGSASASPSSSSSPDSPPDPTPPEDEPTDGPPSETPSATSEASPSQPAPSEPSPGPSPLSEPESPTLLCGTADSPCVVEATPGAIAFLALTQGLICLFLGALLVRSYGS